MSLWAELKDNDCLYDCQGAAYNLINNFDKNIINVENIVENLPSGQ